MIDFLMKFAFLRVSDLLFIKVKKLLYTFGSGSRSQEMESREKLIYFEKNGNFSQIEILNQVDILSRVEILSQVEN